jgi:hypothetical protein
MVKQIALSLIFSFAAISIYCQNIMKEYSSPDIKSVMFGKKGFSLSYPVLEIDEETPLLLTFDDLNHEKKDYYYSIVLCNANWTESRLAPSEYSSGLFSYPVQNYKPSFNTLVPYTHYEIELPNEDVQLKLTGNYIIKVFENSNSENPVLVKRFVFVEKLLGIDAQLKTPILPEFRATSQQIDFSINTSEFPITNPHQELTVVITKNFDWNSALSTLKPQFIKPNSLDYNYTKENLFIGGNEFRSFNINSYKTPSAQVIGVDYDGKKYVATLATDKARNTYFSKEDINGLFVNENKDLHNPDNALESDYFQVNFSLDATNILPYDGDVYLYGALTDFNFNDESKMKYNFDRNIWENSLLLKQGYYEYQYVFVSKATGTFDEAEIEGSFTETENNYFIFLYYRGFGERYDRAVGYKRVALRE